MHLPKCQKSNARSVFFISFKYVHKARRYVEESTGDGVHVETIAVVSVACVVQNKATQRAHHARARGSAPQRSRLALGHCVHVRRRDAHVGCSAHARIAPCSCHPAAWHTTASLTRSNGGVRGAATTRSLQRSLYCSALGFWTTTSVKSCGARVEQGSRREHAGQRRRGGEGEA